MNPRWNRWQDIHPAQATNLNLAMRSDLNPPMNENGDICPWPWQPQQLADAPIGQFHCAYCGAMSIAGVEHLDYNPTAHPLVGQQVTVTIAHKGDLVDDGPALAADVSYTGRLISATYDGSVTLDCPDLAADPITVWPALDIQSAKPERED